jgi:hypothetical protein
LEGGNEYQKNNAVENIHTIAVDVFFLYDFFSVPGVGSFG